MRKLNHISLLLIFSILLFEATELCAQGASKIDGHGDVVLATSTNGGKFLKKLEKVLTDLNFKIIQIDKTGRGAKYIHMNNSDLKLKPVRGEKYRLEIDDFPHKNGVVSVVFYNVKTNKCLVSSTGHADDGFVRGFKGTLEEILNPDTEWP